MDYKNKKFFIYNGCDRGLCLRGCGRQDRQLKRDAARYKIIN